MGLNCLKMVNFLKNHFLYFYKLSVYIVMMTKEGSTKIVNFITPGAGVIVLGRGHKSYIVKNIIFSKYIVIMTKDEGLSKLLIS